MGGDANNGLDGEGGGLSQRPDSDGAIAGALIGCHEPGKLVAVLVVSGNDVSLHFLWSSCRGFMRGVPTRAITALWHATLHAKLQAFKLMPSICRNNARNSMATTDGFSLLDLAVSNYLKALKEELLPAWLGRAGRTLSMSYRTQ